MSDDQLEAGGQPPRQSEIRNPRFDLTVIGVGNWLMGDDGVAPRLIELLRAGRSPEPRIEYLDGGVGGLGLLNWIEQARRLLLIDAADFAARPASCRLLGPDRLVSRIKDAAAGQLSLHQTGLASVLMLAERFYRLPPSWLLVIQVESVERRDGLSRPLADALPRLAEKVRRLARRLLDLEVE